MIISKDENSEWNIRLELNNTIVLYKKDEPMISPIQITDEDALVIKGKISPSENKSMEYEYKFLVRNENWKENVSKTESYKQLYLTKDVNKWQSRIRIINDESALLTIKGPRVGITNVEVEYPIDLNEAINLWNIHEGVRLSKERSIYILGDEKWEIDVFTDKQLYGLQLVEIELPSEDAKIKYIPDWVGEDVTEVSAFRNDSLAGYVYDKKNNNETENIFDIIQEINKTRKIKI